MNRDDDPEYPVAGPSNAPAQVPTGVPSSSPARVPSPGLVGVPPTIPYMPAPAQMHTGGPQYAPTTHVSIGGPSSSARAPSPAPETASPMMPSMPAPARISGSSSAINQAYATAPSTPSPVFASLPEPSHPPPHMPTRTQISAHPQHATGPSPIHSQPTSIRQNPQPRQLSASAEMHMDDGETLSGMSPTHQRPQGLGTGNPLPPLPHEAQTAGGRRPPFDRNLSNGRRSGIDWIVPMDEKAFREKTVGERLEATLLTAIAEKDKYALKAKLTGWTLNIAIGLQVILGALTTGLSATSQSSFSTAILGGLSTVVASYLARARGSNEPELSITRVKDLEQFIRECQAFMTDFGHTLGDKHDVQLDNLRRRFEELLGNANGERRLSPPV